MYNLYISYSVSKCIIKFVGAVDVYWPSGRGQKLRFSDVGDR